MEQHCQYISLFRHEQEEKENAKSGKALNNDAKDEYLTVNAEKLLVMLNNVFTVPRNYRMSHAYRQGASDYISGKFGDLGLLLGLQSFLPTRFQHQVIDNYVVNIFYNQS